MKSIYNEITSGFGAYLKKNKIVDEISTIHESEDLEKKIINSKGKKNIVVLGLNPSSSKKNDEINDDGFLHYMPPSLIRPEHTSTFIGLKSSGRKLFYDQYFKKPHDLFFEHNYIPYWMNPKIGEDLIFEKVKSGRINEFEGEILRSYLDVQNKHDYLYFNDLIPIRITNSWYLKNYFNTLESFIKENFIKERIAYLISTYNPRLILVNNAFVSDLLSNTEFDKEFNSKTYKLVNDKRTILLFSSIMSNGNLDKYSEERLKSEVKLLFSDPS
jgi:hypothetical protein